MPPRQPPTADEITEALHSGTVYRLAEDRVINDDHAVQLLQSRLRTTRARAEAWLLDAVLAGDSELLMVSALGGTVRTANGWASLTELGWTRPEAEALAFDLDGRFDAGISGTGQWVMLRSSLEDFHGRARDRVAAADRSKELATRRRRERFEEAHGDALAIIEAFLADLDRPAGFEDDVVDFKPDGWTKHFGEPGGSLTILLRGRQIRALADKLAATTAADPTTAD